jgi:guanylate kinase
MTTPASLSRSQQRRRQKRQNGTVLSFTTMAHPPSRFGHQPRTIALIALDDGSKLLAPLLCPAPTIGMRVCPRMRLSTVQDTGLRVYDLAFEELIAVREPATPNVFPGYILALTGPSGVGKTTIQRMVISMFSEYAVPVPILTTRARKEGDQNDYRYVSKEKFAELLEAGKLIAATNIPSTNEDRWYGYRASDLEAIWKQGKLPVVVTEMHLLQGLANRYGRRSILSFGLLPPGKSRRAMLSSLLHRLRLRGRETEQVLRDRVKNAAKDLAFFTERRDLFDHFVVNDDTQMVLETLHKHVPGMEKR